MASARVISNSRVDCYGLKLLNVNPHLVGVHRCINQNDLDSTYKLWKHSSAGYRQIIAKLESRGSIPFVCFIRKCENSMNIIKSKVLSNVDGTVVSIESHVESIITNMHDISKYIRDKRLEYENSDDVNIDKVYEQENRGFVVKYKENEINGLIKTVAYLVD